ncbi:transposase domain-containing protein [Ralstonia pseudosolanacearum]
MFYSLTGAARLNGLDPVAYLRYVIEHIADHPVNALKTPADPAVRSSAQQTPACAATNAVHAAAS